MGPLVFSMLQNCATMTVAFAFPLSTISPRHIHVHSHGHMHMHMHSHGQYRATASSISCIISRGGCSSSFPGHRNMQACSADTRTRSWALRSSKGDDGDCQGGDGVESDLSWMKEAMGISPEDEEKENQKNKAPPPSSSLPPLFMQQGIAGFAVDKELGFVCILVGNDGKQFTHATISPTDVEKLSSAEALCLVQLSGGLDLGAAVFPPETLAKIVSESMMESESESSLADDAVTMMNVEELRSRVSLLAVTAVKNENYIHGGSSSSESSDGEESPPEESSSSSSSSPGRVAAIKENAPKILLAVKNLPGLGAVTMDKIKVALEQHADEEGKLDRAAFSQVLDSLRRGATNRISMEDERVSFNLTVSVTAGGGDASKGQGGVPAQPSSSSTPSSYSPGLKLLDVDNVPAFQAVALSLRYKLKIGVSDDCFDEEERGVDADASILDRFPAFKPMQELVDDAQVMDGFISSMFFKQSAPDNDDKMM